MNMTLRWYGTGFDSVTLEQIRQIPGVTGVITTLYDSVPGDAWETAPIAAMKHTVEEAGLRVEGIESVNVHDAIKAGLPERDRYIENYILSLQRLGEADIHMVCYNFMPVFDWTRSDLAKPRPDGSTVLSYDQEIIDQMDPDKLFGAVDAKANGFVLPGWEPERLAHIRDLFALYEGVTPEKLFDNLVYFLNAIMPVCEEYGVNMCVHPDDPPFQVLGLPRIVTNEEDIAWFLNAVDNPHNGLTFCAGSLSAGEHNDTRELARKFASRTHFVHLRSTAAMPGGNFIESSHLTGRGHLIDLIRIFEQENPNLPMRVDHGRMMLGDEDKGYNPGYSFHGRMLALAQVEGMMAVVQDEMKQKETQA